MYVPCRQLIVLAAWLGIAGHLLAAENEQKQENTQAARPPGLMTKVFAISDLLIAQSESRESPESPLPQEILRKKSPRSTGTKRTDESELVAEQLIRVITRTLVPQSWSTQGGPGTIEFLPLTGSLVVRQGPGVLEQIGEFLDIQRRLASRQILLDVTCIELSPIVLERFDEDLAASFGSAAPAPRTKILNAEKATRFIDFLQGDRRCLMVQAGRSAVADGKQVSFACVDRPDGWENILSSTCPEGEKPPTDNSSSPVPAIRRCLSLQVRAASTPNESATWLEYDLMHGWLLPSKTKGTDSIDRCLPLPEKQRVNGKCHLEKGRTLILGLGVTSRETVAEETSVPVLSDIPVIGSLFRSRIFREEPRLLLVLITPQIPTGEE